MYLQHYGFTKDPFHITPDPRFFYLSSSHREAFASMVYGLKKRKGFIAVIGEVGLGKTTVVRSFLQQRSNQEKLKTIFIFNPKITFQGLLRFLFEELEIELPVNIRNESDDTSELVKKLHQFLIEEYSKGVLLVLVIDEAQNMPVETLENLRMLSNLETTQDKLLQIFLVGQPELAEKLNRPELRQLKQRLAVRSTLKPLNKKETLHYIDHRLKRAGLKKQTIFSRKALHRIYQYSKGNPRIINILCDNALVTGFGYETQNIGARIIEEVQRDIQGTAAKPRKLAWSGAFLAAFLLLGGGFLYSPYGESFKREFTQLSIFPQQEVNTPSLSTGDPKTSDPIHEENTGKKDTAKDMEPPKAEASPSASSSSSKIQGSAVSSDSIEEKDILASSSVRNEQEGSSTYPISAYNDSILQPDLDQKDRFVRDELINRLPVFQEVSPVRQKVLIAMAKQTSIRGLMTFKRMIAALEKQDYLEAARQMIDSRWGERTGLYAIKLAEVMYTGHPQGWNSANLDVPTAAARD